MTDRTIVYCDGSSLNNTAKKGNRAGGIGVFFGENDPRNISEPITDDKVTNITTELLACIKALYILKNDNFKGFIYIYTDSMFVINCITTWCKRWEKQGWKKEDKSEIENLELVQELYNLTKTSKVIYKHVRAHMDEPKDKKSEEWKHWYGNGMADMQATAAARSVKLPEVVKEKAPKKAVTKTDDKKTDDKKTDDKKVVKKDAKK
jgi:ribonuclease HI